MGVVPLVVFVACNYYLVRKFLLDSFVQGDSCKSDSDCGAQYERGDDDRKEE